MDEIYSALERLASVLLLPATVFGAGGAILHASRKGKGWRQVITEGFGGILMVHMSSPLVEAYLPVEFHYTVSFMIGWGGLELAGRLYEASASALTRRISQHIAPKGDE